MPAYQEPPAPRVQFKPHNQTHFLKLNFSIAIIMWNNENGIAWTRTSTLRIHCTCLHGVCNSSASLLQGTECWDRTKIRKIM
jgi:hypothetical protein